jgi:hypothetical protein
VGRQTSAGKQGLKSSSRKQVTGNRGGTRPLPATRSVTGAFGIEGADRRTPPRTVAAGEPPKRRRRTA